MKCPKCGYVSFDYNLVCPKCNKDLSVEQEKLNMPAFKPNPPSLLGALLGEAAESGVPLGGAEEPYEIPQEQEVASRDATAAQHEEIGVSESQEIELGLEFDADKTEGLKDLGGILEDSGAGPAVESAGAEPAPESLELDAISLDEAEVFPSKEAKKEEGAEGISFELEDLTLDSKELAQEPEAEIPEEKLEADLDDFSLEDAGVKLESEPAPSPPQGGIDAIDLGSLALEEEKLPGIEEGDEITLNLEDLKVNETGQLEIGKNASARLKGREPAGTEESPSEPEVRPPAAEAKEKEEDLSLLLSEDAVEVSAEAPGNEQQIDLDNLDLELDFEGPKRK